MNKMLVAVFNNETAAYQGLSALKDLHKDGDISLYATAVVAKDRLGAVSVKQTADEGPVGTALGMLTGSMVGLLGGPVGMAAGATAGGLTGVLYDLNKTGVDVDFVDEVSKVLLPGKAAVTPSKPPPPLLQTATPVAGAISVPSSPVVSPLVVSCWGV